MTPKEFLELIWPVTGYYCLALPIKNAKTKNTHFVHEVFETVDAAVAYVQNNLHKTDIYYAIHTLQEKQVFNPHKRVYGTNKLGAMEVRVQRNSKEARCLFFDIDIGKDVNKYQTLEQAQEKVLAFSHTISLPDPTIIKSGNGLHIYWHFKESVASVEWRKLAAKLRRLAEHLKLKIDKSRTIDSASILRVPGTYNHKDPSNLKLVETLQQGAPHAYSDYMRIIDDAIEVHEPDEIYLPKIHTDIELKLKDTAPDELGDNTQDYYVNQAPPSARALLTVCPQMRAIALTKGKIEYKRWYHGTLQTGRFTAEGREFCHAISEGHDAYSRAETDKYLDYLEMNNIGPTKCAFLAELGGRDICNQCPHKDKDSSPIAIARMYTDAATPQATVQGENGVEATLGPDVLVNPPLPFHRYSNLTIAMDKKSKDGVKVPVTILPYDLYPLMRVVNTDARKEQHVWRVTLPRGVKRDFTLDAHDLYDNQKFKSLLPNVGIHYDPDNERDIQKFMTAYIRTLQAHADAQKQCTHLGWVDNQTRFVTPMGAIDLEGNIHNIVLAPEVQVAAVAMHTKGSLEEQIKLMNFYNHDEYLPHQFFILNALGASLMIGTNQFGLVVNASGPSGASKSTALYTGASFWGSPEHLPFNGTKAGATTLGRAAKVRLMGSVAVFVDEITHIEVQEAHNMVMNVTQPNPERDSLTRDGKPKAKQSSVTDTCPTIMLATANTSLHAILSETNSSGTAASMRVLEIKFVPQSVHTKTEADAYMFNLKQHYGHIGPEFIKYVAKNKVEVENRVRTVLANIDTTVRAAGSERYWSASAATGLVSCEIAHAQGLLPFKVPSVAEWYIKSQFPKMRSTISLEYSSSSSILGSYCNHVFTGTVQVRRLQGNNVNAVEIVRAPTQAMVVHHDLDDQELWIDEKAFKKYCAQQGSNMLSILEELSQPKIINGVERRIVTEVHVRKTLAARTTLRKPQVFCFVVDLTHPDICDISIPVPEEVKEDNVVELKLKKQ